MSVLTGLLLLSAGCMSSPSSRHYLLEPLASKVTADISGLRVAVARVTLPGYLKRREIITRAQPFHVDAAPFDRWAAPLEQLLVSVLAENLSVMLPTSSVLAHPWDALLPVDVVVRARVIRLDTDPAGDVALQTVWVLRYRGAAASQLHKSQYRVTPTGDGMTELVAAMSRAITLWSQDIAIAMEAAQ